MIFVRFSSCRRSVGWIETPENLCVNLKEASKISQKNGAENYFCADAGFMLLPGTECHCGMTETNEKYLIRSESRLYAYQAGAAMNANTIIACAVTRAGDTVAKHPAI